MAQGRTPEVGVPRDFALCVRLTPAEREALDDARGSTSRSNFVRGAIRKASGGEKK